MERWGDVLAGNIMDVQIGTLGPSEPVSEAVRIILEEGVAEVAVVDHEGTLLGVVTETALLRGMPFNGSAPGSPGHGGQGGYGGAPRLKDPSLCGATAADFLEMDFFSLPPEAPLSGVAELLAGPEKRGAVVFIVDPGGRLLGGISAKDLLKREWKYLKKKEEKGR